jgi:hypothetical protein
MNTELQDALQALGLANDIINRQRHALERLNRKLDAKEKDLGDATRQLETKMADIDID